jgi:hypothetical protein
MMLRVQVRFGRIALLRPDRRRSFVESLEMKDDFWPLWEIAGWKAD